MQSPSSAFYPPTRQEIQLLELVKQSDPSLANMPDGLLLSMLRDYAPREHQTQHRALPRPTAHSQVASSLLAGLQTPRQQAQSSSVSPSEQLLRVVRSLNRVLALAHVPAALGSQVFMDDPDQRKELLTIMSMLQSMTAAPVISDVGVRSWTNLRDAAPEERGNVARDVAVEVGQESALQAIPMLRALAQRL